MDAHRFLLLIWRQLDAGLLYAHFHRRYVRSRTFDGPNLGQRQR